MDKESSLSNCAPAYIVDRIYEKKAYKEQISHITYIVSEYELLDTNL